MSACSATTRHGKPCGFPARKGTDRGINHEPGADNRRRGSNGGHAAVVARRTPSTHLVDAVLSFTDRASIQAVLDTVARLELAGRISHQRATIVLRPRSIATRSTSR